MNLVAVYIILYVYAVAASIFVVAQTKRFLQTTRSIDDGNTLNRFKSLARVNSWLALVQLVVMLAGMVLGIWLIISQGMKMLLMVLIANGVVFAFGKYLKGFEEQTRSLPSAPGLITDEYRRVCSSWVQKPFPDF